MAGGGGIGSIAIQLAKHLGAYVATTVDGSQADVARSLGADEIIDYTTQAFATLLQDYDAVLVTSAAVLADSYPVLKKGGVLVSMLGYVDDEVGKKYQINAIAQHTATSAAQLSRLSQLVDQGAIKPLLAKTFTLDQTRDAFAYFEQSNPTGKVGVLIES